MFSRLCCKPEAVCRRVKEWLSLLKQDLNRLKTNAQHAAQSEGFQGFGGPVLPLTGATGVVREATECGFGPTKGSDYPVATEDEGVYSKP